MIQEILDVEYLLLKQELYLWFNNSLFFFRHGEAICLDENLLHCRTEKCDTFNNEPLSKDEDFMCKVVEVYGFQWLDEVF